MNVTTRKAPETAAKKKITIPETAMVFAAGFGLRMRPLTEHTPKPLIKVAGKTLLDYRLDRLVEIGVKRAVINTHYLAEQIHAHAARRKDIEICISHEKTILETGGGLAHARKLLGDQPFYIINSDVIWLDGSHQPALLRLAERFDPQRMKMLMLLQPVAQAHGYKGKGDFSLRENGVLYKSGADFQPYVYAGIQLFHPDLIEDLDEKFLSLSHLFKDALDPESKHFGSMHGLVHAGDWLHIDSIEGLEFAENFLANQA